MASLNERIYELEKTVELLLSKIADLSKNTEDKYHNPASTVGGIRDRSLIRPTNVKSGFSQIYGGSIPWNAIDAACPRINTEPTIPTKNTPTYHLHSHSRYTGGALIKDVLEVVEYEWDGYSTNHYAPQHWRRFPKIKTEVNSKSQTVDKIGLLDLVFNPDTLTWGVSSYEIDVKKCYFVERDEDGNIVLDSKGNQKKSSLWNEDTTKTSIIWDENAEVWRLYCVYAPEPE